MTEDQWWYLQAQISAQNALLFALVRAEKNQDALMKQFEINCELLKTASLPSLAPDSFLSMVEKEKKRIFDLLWGQA